MRRLRPLFTIGIHDISYLLEHQAALKRASQQDDRDDPIDFDDASAGWVACTTDSILAVKDGLWDMLITLPPAYSSNAKQRVWPTVECPKGVPVRATQRDLRRFRSLSIGLARLAAAPAPAAQQPPASDSRSLRSEASDAAPTPATSAIRLSSASSRPGTASSSDAAAAQDGGRRRATAKARRSLPSASAADDAEAVVEPTTWAALAYNGFMWWASAGEKRHGDEVEEHSHDAGLLAGLAPLPSPSPVAAAPAPRSSRRSSSFGAAGAGAGSSSMVGSLASLTPTTAAAAAAAPPARKSSGDDEAGEDDRQEEEEEEERSRDESDEESQARVELAVVAYFHRLTTAMLSVLADIVDSADDDDLLDLGPPGGLGIDGGPSRAVGRGAGLLRGEGNGGSDDDSEEARLLGAGNSRGWVRVDSDALAHMGLDVWSQADADFVLELTARYFSRRAYVETKGVEVCGVRVC